jgi:hypothetical protein
MIKEILIQMIKYQNKDDLVFDDVSLELKIYYQNFFNSLTDAFETKSIEEKDFKGKVSSMYHNQYF